MDRKTLRQAKLRELAGFQICGGFEDNLYRLTRIAGELLAAGRVSLMLLDSGHGKGSRLKEPAPGQGIAGQVLATGVSVRVNRIGRSAWKTTARRPDDAGAFMACPLFLAGEPAGVINVSAPIDRTTFSADDLAAAELAALLIARAIQVGRLERMLDSRFAQMALTLEGSADAYTVTALSAHDPDKVAKMLAKGFYKELRHCGFTPNQIIHAAGEIISELTGSLNRHAKRMERGR